MNQFENQLSSVHRIK